MTETVTPPTPAATAGTHRWVSLMVHDLAASQRFYHELFGWEFQEGPQQLGPYVRAVRDGRQVAGLGEIGPRRRARRVEWLPYLATDDADGTAALIRECGGTVAVGPLDVARVGRMVIAADVAGACFGLWQGGRGRRSPLRGMAGIPVWNELVVPDASAVSTFYTMVFGYEARPEPAAPDAPGHLTLRLQGRPVAGIRGVGDTLPHERGAHWLTFFSVPDADAAARRATELGGRLLAGPADSPFGRQAQVADPEGAPFGLVVPARRA